MLLHEIGIFKRIYRWFRWVSLFPGALETFLDALWIVAVILFCGILRGIGTKPDYSLDPCPSGSDFLGGGGAYLLLGATLLLSGGCTTYEPFATTREFSWRWNAPQSHNPIFVENHPHEFLWSILVDVIDSHFEIAREIPIRPHGNVLTEGHLEAVPKIGASLPEFWHADSVGISERLDCTLQTIRRRVEAHVVPETGGYSIEIKVFKELENNPRPLRAVSNVSNLRFQDDADEFADKIDVDRSSAGWSIIERDTALENRLLLEIAYRLQHPPGVIRHSKVPIRR